MQAPLFPRYLFVKLDLERDRWRSVLGTQGVSHLVMEGERPKPVQRAVIDQLLAVSDETGLIAHAPELCLGQSVRLQTGPFSGLVGELLSLDEDGRVCVLLSLLGAPTVVRSSALGLMPAA